MSSTALSSSRCIDVIELCRMPSGVMVIASLHPACAPAHSFTLYDTRRETWHYGAVQCQRRVRHMTADAVESLVTLARGLTPIVRDGAAEADRERRLSQRVARAMAEAGLYRA